MHLGRMGKDNESKESADVAVLTFSDNSQKYVVEFCVGCCRGNVCF